MRARAREILVIVGEDRAATGEHAAHSGEAGGRRRTGHRRAFHPLRCTLSMGRVRRGTGAGFSIAGTPLRTTVHQGSPIAVRTDHEVSPLRSPALCSCVGWLKDMDRYLSQSLTVLAHSERVRCLI
jgi:hypothetical protein